MNTATRDPRARRRVRLAALVALFAVAILALVLRDRDPERGPDGFLALHRFVASLGHEVRFADDPPAGPGVFLLTADFRDPEQDEAILEWVRGGGRLVLGSSFSPLFGELRLSVQERVRGIWGAVHLSPSCDVPEVRGVGRIGVDPLDPAIVDLPPEAASCFRGRAGAFVAALDVGKGRVVVLASSSVFSNQYLRDSDNAVLAANLVAGGGPVVFGSALPAEGSVVPKGLWGSLPTRARVAVIALCVAALAFALVRSRRLGRPISEEPVSPIPSGELVLATGRLYRKAKETAHAGELMRRAAVDRLARRLGTNPSVEDVVREASLRGAGSEPGIRAILGGDPPRRDDALIALGADIERIREHVEGMPS